MFERLKKAIGKKEEEKREVPSLKKMATIIDLDAPEIDDTNEIVDETKIEII